MAKAKRKARAALGISPRWQWSVEARDVFGRFLFVLAGSYPTKDEAELEAARVRSACHDSGRIRFSIVARDCTTPECQRVRALDDNRQAGKTSGAKGARKSVATRIASSRPSRMAPAEDDTPPVTKKAPPSAAKAPVVPRGRVAKKSR